MAERDVHAESRPDLEQQRDEQRQRHLNVIDLDVREERLSKLGQNLGLRIGLRERRRACGRVELVIAKVEGKAKMSQNQPDRNRAGVIAGLQASDHVSDQVVAERVAAFDAGNTNANGRG